MIVHDTEQRSEDWYSLRAGMPTASNFSLLVTSKGEPSKSMPTYAITLAAEMYAGEPVDPFAGNNHTERGLELEDAAIATYEFMRGVTVERVGFVTDNDNQEGCSPDGLVEDGLVEVKCLKAENHIKALLYYQKNGVCPTDYVQQTQGQMMICERKWCDLIFYHPQLPFLVIRQTPNETLFTALRRQLTAVRAERDRVLAALKSNEWHEESRAYIVG